MKIDLVFDILIICLLFPTIIYAVILNHRLKSLRSNQEDFGKLILAFNDATTRAESGTIKLRQLAEHAGTQLKDQVDKAKILREDLAYFLEKADSVANKLEDAIRQGKMEIQNFEGLHTAKTQTPRMQQQAGRTFLDEDVSVEQIEKTKIAPRPKKKNTYADFDDDDNFLNLDETRSDAEKELLRALQAIG